MKQIGQYQIYYLGEISTGDATPSRRQLEHIRTGTVTMVGGGGSAIDLMAGDSFPVVFAGVDRYPGCPEVYEEGVLWSITTPSAFCGTFA